MQHFNFGEFGLNSVALYKILIITCFLLTKCSNESIKQISKQRRKEFLANLNQYTTIFKCTGCNNVFSTARGLNSHITKKHTIPTNRRTVEEIKETFKKYPPCLLLKNE
jgi:uncharacterized C2H2 Zn-finger protein